ncbi:PEP-CTERM sorting domain-containing protein [Thalassomonas viridans]|uniref:PEP-CTERM sorting domain-containing protein n=1 Tax=Thalassomonas viridans TaxID=137584 RepID=A0AAE9Z9K5_9GAMM|nr:PEP-CTERM sorting domain-containing protein [Thalassomonas viridans]WDE08524.1 PEP-CTERM sorting domain-containing protein [Thalassomonas viridans]
MKRKYLNPALILLILFVTSLAGKAYAGLIVGEHYTDASGTAWEYVGSYDLAQGPGWQDVNREAELKPYNGLEAAELLFGVLDAGNEYAISSNVFRESETYEVNHLAWYDGVISYIHEKSESLAADKHNDGLYNVEGDFSAYISDRGVVGEHINHVFKTVDLPEPSTLMIFILALAGLAARRFKLS